MRPVHRENRWVMGWLRESKLGLGAIAIGVGVGSGFGAVGFRALIYGVTWLATGHEQFGTQGRVASPHLPFLGIWFLLLIPAVGGLVYGPLIQRFAREARGHGVPEVMIAVAENGGRIRPRVTVVKTIASAICIGVGGSVGREGPIVQIGSSFASAVGQRAQLSESRMRILVACGAAGGIAATFNAPITGVLFGFELILRELSIEALVPMLLSAVSADVIAQAFFGHGPVFSQIPHGLSIPHAVDYLLVLALALVAALIGVGFKTLLYKVEDGCERIWGSRPEWLMPVVGGLVLGAVLVALPELYGVGYGVLTRAVAGGYVLWFLLILLVGKLFATSLTLGIGGSGGIFAPSLFAGATAGTAFGIIAHHAFGSVVGSPAIYGVIAMGAVFAAAARAPLTSITSVLEMTGNFGLTLPVMLAVGVATGVSRYMTYGTIYTTKLLKRGIDIDRPKPSSVLQLLTMQDVMQPLEAIQINGKAVADSEEQPSSDHAVVESSELGDVVDTRTPQVLLEDESVEQAIRQLVLYGPDGLPVLSADKQAIVGWGTFSDVVRAIAKSLSRVPSETVSGKHAAEWADPQTTTRNHPPSPLDGYELVEIRITETSGPRRVGEIDECCGLIPTAIVDGENVVAASSDYVLRSGDRLIALRPRATKPVIP
jgi:CIC family chloride channel protein